MPPEPTSSVETAPGLVALTGAGGFVGGHIARHLIAAGWRVRALQRRSLVPQGLIGLSSLSGSLNDADSLNALVDGVDAVVHCAGLVAARRRRDFFDINVGGTRALVDAAAGRPNPPKFVLVSSMAARLPEISAYAESKRAAERALADRAGDMAWAVLRPSAVYGPADRATLSLFRAFARGFAPTPVVAGARFSLIYAEDVASGVLALLRSDATAGGIFEVDDRHAGGYSWPEIAAVAERRLGRRVRRLPLRLGVTLLAAHVIEGLARATGRASVFAPDKVREMFYPDWVCRDAGLGRLTGWRPAVGIDEGFGRTFDWYRSEGWL